MQDHIFVQQLGEVFLKDPFIQIMKELKNHGMITLVSLKPDLEDILTRNEIFYKDF